MILGSRSAPPDLLDSIASVGLLDELLRDHPGRPTDGAAVEGRGPVVDLVRHLIHHAFAARASDLHLEPHPDMSRVRLRIDGTMVDAAHLPITLHGALVNRVKVLADLDIVDHRHPQDGQFTLTVDEVAVDVRVSSMPTVSGEKIVLRLLDPRRTIVGLGELGMSESDAELCRRLVRAPYGLVLCTGPTGAGKTTTLYASLLEVDIVGRNVTTIEDPVEYTMAGVTQVPTSTTAGVTFSTGLRALLRQDPDVIMVGEIRDADTARIAVQAALTGHLVVSSIHGVDAVGALHRLLDMGVEPFLVASAVTGVIGQRLVRRVCTACARRRAPNERERQFLREHGSRATPPVIVVGSGCDACARTGFRGRIGVYEVMVVDEPLRDHLMSGESADRTRRFTRASGMRSLATEVIELVERGITTVGEAAGLLHVV